MLMIGYPSAIHTYHGVIVYRMSPHFNCLIAFCPSTIIATAVRLPLPRRPGDLQTKVRLMRLFLPTIMVKRLYMFLKLY